MNIIILLYYLQTCVFVEICMLINKKSEANDKQKKKKKGLICFIHNISESFNIDMSSIY